MKKKIKNKPFENKCSITSQQIRVVTEERREREQEGNKRLQRRGFNFGHCV